MIPPIIGSGACRPQFFLATQELWIEFNTKNRQVLLLDSQKLRKINQLQSGFPFTWSGPFALWYWQVACLLSFFSFPIERKYTCELTKPFIYTMRGKYELRDCGPFLVKFEISFNLPGPDYLFIWILNSIHIAYIFTKFLLVWVNLTNLLISSLGPPFWCQSSPSFHPCFCFF